MTTQTTRLTRRIDRRELIVHRANFHANRMVGPLLRWVDLSYDAQFMLTSEVVRGGPVEFAEKGAAGVHARVLHSWGVMCPHPLERRLYDGFRHSAVPLPFETDPWFSCGLCGTRVLNRGA